METAIANDAFMIARADFMGGIQWINSDKDQCDIKQFCAYVKHICQVITSALLGIAVRSFSINLSRVEVMLHLVDSRN